MIIKYLSEQYFKYDYFNNNYKFKVETKIKKWFLKENKLNNQR